MTDPVIADPLPKPTIEMEASAALSGVKAEINKLKADEKSATGWVKAHTAWLIGLVCFVVGALLGHVLHK